MKDSFKQIFKEKKRVIVVMSHPDDAEAFSAGTIARLTRSGILVRVVKMTSGNRGSKQDNYSDGELMKMREEEDMQSMKILGVLDEDNIYLRLGDGEIENSIDSIGRVAYQIREFKPDLVITQNPDDIIAGRKDGLSRVNHRDHRNTARSVIDAMYPYSRDISFFPEHFKDPKITSHTTTEILMADSHNHADELFIEITDFMQDRENSIACHKSQFDPEVVKRVTYDMPAKSGKRFFERFRYAKIR